MDNIISYSSFNVGRLARFSISFSSWFFIGPLFPPVEELEEKLHRCEAEQLSSTQRVQVLEGQLRSVQGELSNNIERLQELKDALQRTQTISDERQAQVDKLSVRLR